MLNSIDIKNRIKSIKDTRQITKAMELISISKMKKANIKYENNLTYFQKVRQTIKDILTHSAELSHPYLKRREGSRTAYVVIAADKGLAGGYNKNVLNLAWQHMKDVKEKYVFTIGQMAREFFNKKNIAIDIEFLYAIQDPNLNDARRIAADILELYEKDLMDEVLVVFTKMENTFIQKPMIIKLLPVELDDLIDVKLTYEYRSEIKYDSSDEAVLNVLVPQYIIGLLYAMLVQSAASEHCERMLAMGSATKNADKMLEKLSLNYNRARQAAITSSILEIGSATNLKGE